MFNRKAGLLAFGLVAATLLMPLQTLNAQSTDLNEIEFSSQTSNVVALNKAERLYQDYMENHSPEGVYEDNDQKALARYLPLDPENPKRFLGYYIFTGTYDECPLLGCNLMVFENYSGNDWRVVMNVFTHAVRIDENSATPKTIHTLSRNFDQINPKNGKVWGWDETKNTYVFKGEYSP